MRESLSGAVLTSGAVLPYCGEDLGYFPRVNFWLLAELIAKKIQKLPFWGSFKPRDNWLGYGLAGAHNRYL